MVAAQDHLKRKDEKHRAARDPERRHSDMHLVENILCTPEKEH